MQFKASIDYGLRAMLYLAAQGATCSSKDIAQDMSVPRDYLIQLAQLLRNAGLIEARPGKHGGYRLARDPSDISVLQVMRALGEDDGKSTREGHGTQGGGALAEGIRRSYDLVEESMDAYLDSLTIKVLLESATADAVGRRRFLADRLEEEGRRLAAGR